MPDSQTSINSHGNESNCCAACLSR